MSFDLTELADAVAEHGTVGRIVIADHAGSAPRETGTSMLVWQTGQGGTIGGGTLEFEATSRLRARLAKGGTTFERLPLGPALGQCCGGSVALVSEVYDTNNLPNSDRPFARRVSGDREMPLAMKGHLARHRNGQQLPSLMFDGGWLVEAIRPEQTPVWIYGAGHVGRAIVAALAPLPQFNITWIDTNADRFPDSPPAGVTILPATNPAATVALAPANAHHLILTYSHALDLELCHQVLSHPFASAGLIGSATKWARFKKRLTSLGHTPLHVRQITCPIGDPALGKHPQAIALGVASRLVIATLDSATLGRRAKA